jgi:galactokinase
MTVRKEAETLFQLHFKEAPQGVAAAPGRVNLIGDHTDYEGGLVLPAALRLMTAIAYRQSDKGEVRAVTAREEGEARFSLGEKGVRGWAAYLAGVAWTLQEEGFTLSGLDVAVASEVPSGAGLSSSAALEVAAAKAWREADDLDLDDTRLALLSRRAENAYVGVPCGIMDQFAASVPKPGQAIKLDCRSLDYELLTIPEGWSFVVVNSGASRKLAGSAYRERVAECREIAGLLEISSLRDLELEDLERLEGDLRKRARHVFYENRRVEAAARALSRDEIRGFGELMTDSHLSLKDDYEVSSAALDRLVEAASSFKGCYGSRLTGAGFGGCTVHLVKRGREEAFVEHLKARYPQGNVVALL